MRNALIGTLLFVSAATSVVAESIRFITPCRVIDTRVTLGPQVGAFNVRLRVPPSANLGGQAGCALPKYATGAILSVIAVPPHNPGHLQVHAFGATVPVATRMNYGLDTVSGEITTALAILGSAFDVTFNLLTSSHLVVDLVGFTAPDLEVLVGQATGTPGAGVLTITTLGGQMISAFAPPQFATDWQIATSGAVGSCVHVDGFWVDATTFEARSLPIVMPGSCI